MSVGKIAEYAGEAVFDGISRYRFDKPNNDKSVRIPPILIKDLNTDLGHFLSEDNDSRTTHYSMGYANPGIWVGDVKITMRWIDGEVNINLQTEHGVQFRVPVQF